MHTIKFKFKFKTGSIGLRRRMVRVVHLSYLWTSFPIFSAYVAAGLSNLQKGFGQFINREATLMTNHLIHLLHESRFQSIIISRPYDHFQIFCTTASLIKLWGPPFPDEFKRAGQHSLQGILESWCIRFFLLIILI